MAGILVAIADYTNKPGATGEIPEQWPAASGLARDPHLPTLVMFAHPHCPCTRASLGELELLMAHCPGRLNAEVVFLRPAGFSEEWVKSDSWKSAAAIPGVKVSMDNGGAEIERFQAKTSGTTVLYDAAGKLRFRGGITGARGHMGDNDGRDAVEAILLGHDTTRLAQAPVFGCALVENQRAPEGAWNE